MLAPDKTNKPLSDFDNFHFDYTLELKKHELEGMDYIGIGVLAKMVDTQGNEVSEHIQDITSKPEIAQKLIQLLTVSKVSPMCLKMFVVDFLISN